MKTKKDIIFYKITKKRFLRSSKLFCKKPFYLFVLIYYTIFILELVASMSLLRVLLIYVALI